MKPFARYRQSGEINFKVEDKDGKIRELAEKFRSGKIDYLDGITVDLGDWWFNVRKSNTESMLRLNLEGKTTDIFEQRFEELKNLLGVIDQG